MNEGISGTSRNTSEKVSRFDPRNGSTYRDTGSTLRIDLTLYCSAAVSSIAMTLLRHPKMSHMLIHQNSVLLTAMIESEGNLYSDIELHMF